MENRGLILKVIRIRIEVNFRLKIHKVKRGLLKKTTKCNTVPWVGKHEVDVFSDGSLIIQIMVYC